MDNRIIILVASVAFVALVAGGCYYFCHDDNIYLKSLDDEDGCAVAFTILDTDRPGDPQPMKEGAVVYKNTTIVGSTMDKVKWHGEPYYDDERSCVVAECLYEQDNYVFNMVIKKAERVAQVFISDAAIVIEVEGVERGFSLAMSMSYDRLSNLLIGDWEVESSYEGWYVDDEVMYMPAEITAHMKIRKSTGLLYMVTYNNLQSYCAWNFGTAFFGNIDGTGSMGYIRPDGDDLVMTGIESVGFGLVIRFKNMDHEHQAPVETASDAAASDVPAAGTSWDAVKAYEIDDDTETDIMDRGYKFTMLRVEADMIFYKVKSQVDDLRFVAVRAPQGFWLSAALAEKVVTSTAYFDPDADVLYTSSYGEKGEWALCSIIYGNAAEVMPMDRYMLGKPYVGSQHAVQSMGGEILEGPATDDVSLTFIRQFGNVAMAETDVGLQDAKWGMAIQVAKPEGYVFMIEANANELGEDYRGLYIGMISADLSHMSLSGALLRDDGAAVVFTQDLHPSLK